MTDNTLHDLLSDQAPVEVLGVLTDLAALHPRDRVRIDRVYVAVAELIEAAELAADWIDGQGFRLTDGTGRSLRDALTRMQGGAA